MEKSHWKPTAVMITTLSSLMSPPQAVITINYGAISDDKDGIPTAIDIQRIWLNAWEIDIYMPLEHNWRKTDGSSGSSQAHQRRCSHVRREDGTSDLWRQNTKEQRVITSQWWTCYQKTSLGVYKMLFTYPSRTRLVHIRGQTQLPLYLLMPWGPFY